MQIRDEIEYYSLYEYLGYAAGQKLGKEVNNASIKTKQKCVTQHVEQGGYKGVVQCYTTEFLDEYFRAVENNMQLSLPLEKEEDNFDDLPF